MTRRGKIARLPRSIREQVNRQLQNGVEGKIIVEWLNTLPQVAKIMKGKFDGLPVNDTNLSNWKLGGYRDWDAQQDLLQAVRQFREDDSALRKAAGFEMADQLALALAARFAAVLQQLAVSEDDPDAQLKKLRQLRAEVTALRRGDHEIRRLQFKCQKSQLEWKKYHDNVAERNGANYPGGPRQGGVPMEVLDQIEKDLKLM
jgi:hypothetical protein